MSAINYKTGWRKDECECGYKRFILIHRGQSIFHGSKCPMCKWIFKKRNMMVIPEGSIMVNCEESL